MRVILVDSIPSLGGVGDVVEVKNGYAKNFLIPTKKAMFFDKINQEIFESKKNEFEKRDLEKFELFLGLKDKLNDQNVILILNSSDEGKLYGSVTVSLVASRINQIVGDNLVLSSNIFLNKPIKETGIHKIDLKLHKKVSFSINLVVARSNSEADSFVIKTKSS